MKKIRFRIVAFGCLFGGGFVLHWGAGRRGEEAPRGVGGRYATLPTSHKLAGLVGGTGAPRLPCQFGPERAITPRGIPKGLPGLEKLRKGGRGGFYARFLTLPDEQLKWLTDYLEAGKPMVGFRTSTHAFAYPNSPNAKWNDGFGHDALGSKYFIHGKGPTKLRSLRGRRSIPCSQGWT